MTDWAVGDLAVCVDTLRPEEAKPGRSGGDTCRKGAVFTVIGIARDAWGNVGLILDDIRSDHPTGGYLASAFRKIRPDKHEECEPEFVTLLKRSKRRVSA
jgi:hypothetical protein